MGNARLRRHPCRRMLAVYGCSTALPWRTNGNLHTRAGTHLPRISTSTVWPGWTSPGTRARPIDTPSVGDIVPLVTSRSEEHTSELQSRENLVCRLLLEKKNYVHH